MKKVVVLAAAGLLLTSVVAYAQMRHHADGNQEPMHQSQNGETGSGMAHAAMMHEHMQHGGMHQANAASGSSSHALGQQGMQPKGDNGPSSLAFNGINAKMHGAMDITFTGNADIDFAKGMIPHHQGAIDMAKTVLAFGKDPALKTVAEEIIKSQEAEIVLMNEWLKKNGQ